MLGMPHRDSLFAVYVYVVMGGMTMRNHEIDNLKVFNRKLALQVADIIGRK